VARLDSTTAAPARSGYGETVTPERMRSLVVDAQVARLATVGADGRPHLVPVCFTLVGDVVYTAVDHKPKRSPHLRRIANLQATGYACLLVDAYSEDWSALWWVRMDGRGRVVDEEAEITTAVTSLTAKYPQYAARPPRGPVLAVDVSGWNGWSAS
jgi:PPOX class probable F420-dependent enzyme